jgi:hypothetical protein
MNDAKPWVTWQVDGSTTWVGSNEDWRAKTLATCCQRDELEAEVAKLRLQVRSAGRDELVALLQRFFLAAQAECWSDDDHSDDPLMAETEAVLTKWGGK